MTFDSGRENLVTLQRLLGLEATQADAVLHANAQVTVGDDHGAQFIGKLVCRLLRRTIHDAGDAVRERAAVEIIIGNAAPRTAAHKVWVTSDASALRIGTVPSTSSAFECHRIFGLIAACHAAATAVRLLMPEGRVPFTDPIVLSPGVILGTSAEWINARVHFGKSFLAGAGAVGNAFLLALSLFDVDGELHVVDPDGVSDGNLNRTILFESDDIGLPKAEVLVRRASSLLPHVRLVPRTCRIQELDERSDQRWLHRIIVGVDSRRARRGLQEELPLHVFDASTTGIQEILVTFYSATSGLACMGCNYPRDREENAHEQHVADLLGVSIGEVQGHYISAESAATIASRYPQVRAADVTGTAYDTLFKQLCSAGELPDASGVQVLAPLAFVSVLAGAYLALEFVRRVEQPEATRPFNYWRGSPWASPVAQLRATRQRFPACECCRRPEVQAIVEELWGRAVEGKEEG